ncbi:MAG: hypothetical protein NVS1B4_03740 [Gemmatimonadaceae bacterium]
MAGVIGRVVGARRIRIFGRAVLQFKVSRRSAIQRATRIVAVTSAGALLLALAPRDACGQDTTARGGGGRASDSLSLARPAALLPLARLGEPVPSVTLFAELQEHDLRRRLRERERALLAERVGIIPPPARVAVAATTALEGPRPSPPAPRPSALLRAPTDLSLKLDSRLEVKGERNKNERCASSQLYDPLGACSGSFTPSLDLQFAVKSGGVFADRIHVNVDYQSLREFEGSNNVSLYYEGRRDEILHRVEVGNVTFTAPTSRYITAGIPSGNYGVQAIGQLGPMHFRAIAAQQKGNVVRDRVFTVGGRTLQGQEREIEDYQIEPRRFFFTVDPRRLGGFPNIDILDAARMATLAQALPDSERPRKVFVYRLRIGSPPPDPNGPQFVVRGLENSARGQTYEYLREGVDYYADPSQLWIALVNPAQLNSDRIVVAYRVRVRGVDTVSAAGGSPDLSYAPQRPQFANLVYDPTLKPGDDAFFREIRSVYRIGGEDVQRRTIAARIVAGASGTQEKPPGGGAESYLQLFGLSQRVDATQLDVENRIWPRPSDPNVNLAAGTTAAALIRDYFLVFPSLRPFAAAGFAGTNPANDTLYTTPSEYLYSAQHPTTIYRLRVQYQSAGGNDPGTLQLGSVQLRRNSERILLDGVALRRDIDYRVDYDLGRVSFARADTLFPRPRQVTVQYEENPLFAATPTNIFGLTTTFPTENGQLSFTAISQSQSTQFTRPTLGLEPAASFIAGVTGSFTWQADALTGAINKLPLVTTAAPSFISLSGEFATSRPRPNSAGQAYLESFEGDAGTAIALGEQSWYYSSLPALGTTLTGLRTVLDTSRVTTLAWQNTGVDRNGQPVVVRVTDIDTLARYAGGIATPFETVLWLTMYPLTVGGRYDPGSQRYRWTVPGAPRPGRRWRSLRTVLSPSGLDLSRTENVEFWALIDTTAAGRTKNPTLVLDFGDISERTVAIAPDTLVLVRSAAGGVADTLYRGRRVAGLDGEEHSERDPRTRTFNADVNDTGLPGDVADVLRVAFQDAAGVTVGRGADLANVPTCTAAPGRPLLLGDSRANCTVRNYRLDEEDIDGDGVLNFTFDKREQERILRYAVDLGSRTAYDRTGNCGGPQRTVCWAHFKIPFGAPSETLNQPVRRRLRALRVTMVSAPGLLDDEFTQIPIARLRLTGAPWLRRGDQSLAGVGAEAPAPTGGFVRVSTIGTDDSSATLEYEPPPGVGNEADTKTASYRPGSVQINEHSLRIQAGNLPLYGRAEGYYRFPEGEKNFMGYRQMRLWGRGRGRGWDGGGELEMFVRIGRDPHNFYLYRTPVRSGRGQDAWLPEVRIDFARFLDLRAKLQNAYLKHAPDTLSCSGTDLALVTQSALPAGARVARHAACDGGYMVYTVDPGVSPPNLAAVQELAVGIVRVRPSGSGPTSTLPGDTLELWVDDIRLGDVVDTPGYAGQIGLSVVAGDVASVRVNVARRDANFRQLAEQATFITDDAVDVSSTVRLDKFLPRALGMELPFTITHTSAGQDPLFVSRSDLRGGSVEGLRTPRVNTTAYALTLRRTSPLGVPVIGPLLNNLAMTGGYTTAGNRTEFGVADARNTTIGAEYVVAPDVAPRTLPFWLGGALVGGRALRLLPVGLRLASNLLRSIDERAIFGKPAVTADDAPSVSHGEQKLWRNVAGIEWHPLDALSAHWDVQSVRDLRRYADSSAIGAVSRFERDRLLGVDVGLERERLMSTSLAFAPEIRPWLRPRVDAGTSYSMLRDPNGSARARDGDGSLAALLPRRLTSSQNASAGVTVDIAEALRPLTGGSGFVRSLVAVLQPVDVSVGRNLLSLVDGTKFSPTLGYQFGLGGVDGFRIVGGRPATSAGLTNTFALNNSLLLPFGAALVNRYNRVTTRNWTRRSDSTLAVVDGVQRTFPDLSLRWNFQPAFLGDLVTSVGAQAGFRDIVSSSLASGVVANDPSAESSVRIRTYPMNASVAWGYGSGLSTAAGFTATRRDDRRAAGTLDRSAIDELSVDMGKAFAVPERWGFKSDVRTSIGYQTSRTQTFVTGLTADALGSRRTAGNGRRAFNINADTDFDQNVTFSLQGSQIVTFDNNLNRRFTQTVITASIHLSFFAGDFR